MSSDLHQLDWRVLVFVALVGFCVGCGDMAEGRQDETLQSNAYELNTANAMFGECRNGPAKNKRSRFDKSPSLTLRAHKGLAHLAGTVDDPREVRETGFTPVDESDDDDPRFVRETGFIPAPRISHTGTRGSVVTVEWPRVEGADYYVVSGIRFSADGGPADSFDFRADGTLARFDTEGRVTQVIVVAVAENSERRSRPSNKLTVFPELE
ncbi:MAG: hypothetical protein ACON3Z_16685 [Bradymonadia bacterium]